MQRVAVIIETALASGRSLLAGISQFARELDTWELFHPTGYLGATELSGLENWEGDGIIARIPELETLRVVESKAVPVVDVLGNVADSSFPLVTSDDPLIGNWVARNFIENGHRNFAFIGLAGEVWSLERERGFREEIRETAFFYRCCELEQPDPGKDNWKTRVEELSDLFRAMPKPCAVMISSDQLGPTVMATCQRLGFAVPDEISLIGVDNDLPFCELCRPRLSSVEPNHFRAGYEAARLLNEALVNGSHSTRRLEIPPIRLHERPSSEANAVDDPSLVRALQFIRARACSGISVDDVARACGLSRSVLQRRFRGAVGKSVLEVIQSIKVRRARDLLEFTQLGLSEVAERSGYSSQEYFTASFGRQVGSSPLAYRRGAGESRRGNQRPES